MTQNVFQISIAVIFLLAACTPAVTTAPVVTLSASETPSPTHSPFPTETVTPSITPLPTIPTFTPTFDVSTIVTATSALPANCPEEDPNLKSDVDLFQPENYYGRIDEQAFLDGLNNGINPRTILTTLVHESRSFHPDMGAQQDLTGDSIAELILTDNHVVYVFGCRNEHYQVLFSYAVEPAWLQEFHFTVSSDMNLNGLPELIIDAWGGHTYYANEISIVEWNGNDFSPLLRGKEFGNNQYESYVETPVLARVEVRDFDGNGTLELIIQNDLPSPLPSYYSYEMPWRNETDIYSWNGSQFVLTRVEYASPEFRFQAIQDADHETLYGAFEEALILYQEVIFNKHLRPFSREILMNEIARISALNEGRPVPTPVEPNLGEYPGLAAYAYYRIMVLQIVQGNMDEANTTYEDLQQKFGTDPYGVRYVELATVFWTAYQTNGNIPDSCGAAIAYATEHSEILGPLGSDYHNSQSYVYEPKDICPFR